MTKSQGQLGIKPKRTRRVGKTPAQTVKNGRRWTADDITETPEQLRLLLIKHGNDEPNSLIAKRIKLLLLLKTGAAKSASAAQKMLGVAWTSVSSWMSQYEQFGVQALLSVNKGGRLGLPEKARKQIIALHEKGKEAEEIATIMAAKGVQITKWGVYPIVKPPDGQQWQCKTTAVLDKAIEAWAIANGDDSPDNGGDDGRWYFPGDGPCHGRHNLKAVNRLILIGLDYPGLDRIPPRQPYGIPGARGSHLGFRFDGATSRRITAAARVEESKNTTLRRLIEAGLVASGYDPGPEPPHPRAGVSTKAAK